MKHNVMQNPDKEFVKNQKKRIKSNSGYCPCRIEKTSENKCPCEDFRNTGECLCGLYIKDPTAMMEEMFP